MDSLPEWYIDAARRTLEIQNGCLPPKVGMNPKEFSNVIGDYTSDDLRRFNPDVMDMLTECEFPYHIIGITKDHLVAYFGLNYVSARPSDELLDILDKMLTNGATPEDKKVAMIAKSELVDLLS